LASGIDLDAVTTTIAPYALVCRPERDTSIEPSRRIFIAKRIATTGSSHYHPAD